MCYPGILSDKGFVLRALNLNRVVLLLLFMLPVLFAACGGETEATPASSSTSPASDPTIAGIINTVPIAPVTPVKTPDGGLTLKGAFALADPPIRAWKADAVYIAIFNPLDSQTGMDEQGRSLEWYFQVLSPSAGQRSNWLVKSTPDGKATTTKSTEDTPPKSEVQLLENRKLPPITSLIDTDQLREVARQNGGSKSDRPVGTRLARSTKEGEPLAFDLLFYQADTVLRVRVDAQTGKTLENVKG